MTRRQNLLNLYCLTVAVAMMTTASVRAESVSGGASQTIDLVEKEPDASGMEGGIDLEVDSTCGQDTEDRIWLISSRGLSNQAGCLDLESPKLTVYRLDRCGRSTPSSLNDYFLQTGFGATSVIYVHGYRFDSCDAIKRGLFVYRQTSRQACAGPVDWVIWSWPSERDGWIGSDIREKARYTDAQGLYLAWLLREHYRRSIPMAMVGYSFGGRVITGSLHALSGGSLGRQVLNGEFVNDARIDVALVAPAIENDWLSRGGYHSMATNNIDQLLILYNRRDAVLKRYWLLDRVRGAVALGLGNLRSLSPRIDGSQIGIVARDYSRWIGITHDETDYYNKNRSTSWEVAQLIQRARLTHQQPHGEIVD